MTHSESDSLKDEIEEALYQMIEDGVVEIVAIDEQGDFIYGLTDLGKDLASAEEDLQ
jgi:helix-turn-helix protein